MQVVTLDGYLEQRRDVTIVRLLKIDVEGHEVAVFDGLWRTLREKAVEVVVFEITPPDHPSFRPAVLEIPRKLANLGYEVRGLGRSALHPIAQVLDSPAVLAPGYNIVATTHSSILASLDPEALGSGHS